MRLVSFYVEKFRSILTTHKIKTNNMTILIGKSNEGKSNVLRALSLAMEIMQLYAERSRGSAINKQYVNTNISEMQITRYLGCQYDWEKDYPISLQMNEPDGCSSVKLTFGLTDEEMQKIRSMTAIGLNGDLVVKISMGRNKVQVDIPMRGTSAFDNIKNKRSVIAFICEKIDFNFIPAVRTDHDAINVISKLIQKELSALEDGHEYITAITTVEKLQQEILNKISAKLTEHLQIFLPSVETLRVNIQKDRRRAALRQGIDVLINDGVLTPIQQKGDGVKSLTALAMLNISDWAGKVSIIAIEEPESHLHPGFARQLHETITGLSANHQVILTTHSPLFVNRVNIEENIIVDHSKAITVKKIEEICNILGVNISDNLYNAENILIVEGENDKVVLKKLLPKMSDLIKKAIQNGSLIIDYIDGASKLPHRLSIYRNFKCSCHVLLDDDEEGRRAGNGAGIRGLIDSKDITYTKCNGSPKAELEDCYDSKAYQTAVLEKFGVDIDVSEFRGNAKWSDRIDKCFRSQGKQWNDEVEKKVKIEIAKVISAKPETALNPHKCTAINALVRSLENMLK